MRRMVSSSIRWDCSPYRGGAAAEIERELGVSRTVAAILVRRGHETPAAAKRFLHAADRHDPFAFAGMREACALILEHVARGSRIVVHGDYDVDGVSSTAILVRSLRRLGADPGWHLPSRFDGGYGLSTATVEDLVRAGTGLLIAVDCGITSAPEIDAAQALGLDAVVVDHHRPAERLPSCPIVHPTVSGYPFGNLCAAGVALKLARALEATAGQDPELPEEDLDLVALATVADLVPLRGENRRLVREGLRVLARTSKPGLRALMAVANVDPARIDADALGFRLAPRLNAAGRLGRADGALELLLGDDRARADEVAAELDLLNRERRSAEQRILLAAEAARGEAPEGPALVLAGEGWHPGVIGIVASRMVERHGRPCILVALEGDSGRGSGRSIPAYDLHAGLTACAHHLGRFGGHPAAAGLEIEAASFDAFRAAFLAHARALLSPDDLVPVERVDAVVPATALGLPLAEELELLAPFGQGNPRPTLLVPAARVGDVRSLGPDGEHAALTLSSGGARARVVAFGTTPASLSGRADRRQDVAARLELNEWGGAVEPRLVLRALTETEEGGCAVLGGEVPFWNALERELAMRLSASPDEAAGARTVSDRRGEGFAGTVGDLLSSGDDVLVVCADVPRRRRAVEGLVGALGQTLRGGRGRCTQVALVAWTALERDPGLARPYPHLVALDPPETARGERLLDAVPGPTGPDTAPRAHACWGRSEVDFVRGSARARLELRPALTELYRALRAGGGELSGEGLARALCGEGPYPRDFELCSRLLRVLEELELADYTCRGGDEPVCRLRTEAPRAELERSPTYRASLARLEESHTYLREGALRARLDPFLASTGADGRTFAANRRILPAQVAA